MKPGKEKEMKRKKKGKKKKKISSRRRTSERERKRKRKGSRADKRVKEKSPAARGGKTNYIRGIRAAAGEREGREYSTPTLDISIRIHTVFCRSEKEP